MFVWLRTINRRTEVFVLSLGVVVIALCVGPGLASGSNKEEPPANCARAWVSSTASVGKHDILKVRVRCPRAAGLASNIWISRVGADGKPKGKDARLIDVRSKPWVAGKGKTRTVRCWRNRRSPYPFSKTVAFCSVRPVKAVTFVTRLKVPRGTQCRFTVQVRTHNAYGAWLTPVYPSPTEPEVGGDTNVRNKKDEEDRQRPVIFFGKPKGCPKKKAR